MRTRIAILAALVAVPMFVAAHPVAAAAPSNDDPSGAYALSFDAPMVQDFTEATASPADPLLCGTTLVNTVWYAYTPTEREQLEVNVEWTGTDAGAVGIYTDAPEGWACGNTATVEAGHTYYVMLGQWSYMASSGPVTLSMTALRTPAPLPEATVRVVSATSNRKTGTATVVFEARCSGPLNLTLSAVVTQNVGRFFTVTGASWVDTTCDSSPGRFTALFHPSSGRFGGGRATLTWEWTASNGVDATYGPREVTEIQIRG